MTKEDIQQVLDRMPDLNSHGIGVSRPRQKAPEQRRQELDEGRRELLASAGECTRVCNWLRNVAPIKSINYRHSSYGLKDIAEHDIGDVTNGAFIVAAIHCGFPCRINPQSANPSLGVSEKSIKEIKRRQNEEGKANWTL